MNNNKERCENCDRVGTIAITANNTCPECGRDLSVNPNRVLNEVCRHIILTPSPEHEGGLWCAEKRPCKLHPQPESEVIKVTLKALEDHKETFKTLAESDRECNCMTCRGKRYENSK